MRVQAVLALLIVAAALKTDAVRRCESNDYPRYEDECDCGDTCLDNSYCLNNENGGTSCQCLPCDYFNEDLGECVPGQAPTKPPADPPTDPPTNPPTDPPTNPPTDPPTNPPTNPPTDPPVTDPPTDPPVTCGPGYVVSASGQDCEDIDECVNNPCEHNCKNLPGSFACSCNDGFVVNPEDFTKCDVIKVCPATADMIFVIDASSSIGSSNYALQLQFATRIVSHFVLGADRVRFGALIFSWNVVRLFDLNYSDEYDKVAAMLLSAPNLNSSTYTHKAFKYIRDADLFSPENGGRDEPGFEKIVILFTDGKSNRPSSTIPEATALKEAGYIIVTLGIGDDISVEELEEIASSKSDVFLAQGFEFLDYVQAMIARCACEGKHRDN